MLYDKVKFKHLFKSKRAAVVSYLSLERKYMALYRVHRDDVAETKRRLF